MEPEEQGEQFGPTGTLVVGPAAEPMAVVGDELIPSQTSFATADAPDLQDLPGEIA